MRVGTIIVALLLSACSPTQQPSGSESVNMTGAEILRGLETAQTLCYDHNDAKACQVIIAAMLKARPDCFKS